MLWRTKTNTLEFSRRLSMCFRVKLSIDIAQSVIDMFVKSLKEFLVNVHSVIVCCCVWQEDDKLLKTLFAQITDDDLDDVRRRDLVLFLKEFCAFSQTLQQDSKNLFFKVIISLC